MEVTVNNVTVIITDYKPKKKPEPSASSQDNQNTSRTSSTQSSPSKDSNDSKLNDSKGQSPTTSLGKSDTSLTNGDSNPKEESS